MALGATAFAGLSCLVILTLLVLDLAGILRRGTSFGWQAVGLLFMSGVGAANTFCHLHKWTGGQISAFESATFPLLLAGFALFMLGVAVQTRERPKQRQAS